MTIDTAALIAALILAAVFALGGQRVLAQFWHHRKWISAAAGVSVAYVFVDVLPELAAQNEALTASIANALYADQRIYFLALLSFVFFYGLEHLVLSSRSKARAEEAKAKAKAASMKKPMACTGCTWVALPPTAS